MSRSDKPTIKCRVDDVVRLLVAGAGLAGIQQYAAAHGWGVSNRQVRRYHEMAYKRLAVTYYRALALLRRE